MFIGLLSAYSTRHFSESIATHSLRRTYKVFKPNLDWETIKDVTLAFCNI